MTAWHWTKWQVVAPTDEAKAGLRARFEKAGLQFLRWANHVPEFDGDVDFGQVQAIAEGSLTQPSTPSHNEMIPEASAPVQAPKAKGKKRAKSKKGGE